ncbi:MAG: hypothetical protein ACYCUF_12375, partial [Acidimicrobiales bacterium]
GTPQRICDTRTSQPTNECTGHTLGAGGVLNLEVAGLAGIPADAKAVVVAVTATDTTGNSFLTVWPSGVAMPLASDLNWHAGSTKTNLVLATVGANGDISIYNYFGAADVIVDVFGWYA